VLLVGRLGCLLGGAAVMRTTVALAAALALGIFAVPLAGDAQQATKLWRVGHLGYAYPTAAKDLEADWAIRHHLEDVPGSWTEPSACSTATAPSSPWRPNCLAAPAAPAGGAACGAGA